jgi:hypothetical protein
MRLLWAGLVPSRAGRRRPPPRTTCGWSPTFTPIGDEFTARPGVWVGAKVGVFALSGPAATASGHADWDWFRVEPQPLR